MHHRSAVPIRSNSQETSDHNPIKELSLHAMTYLKIADSRLTPLRAGSAGVGWAPSSCGCGSNEFTRFTSGGCDEDTFRLLNPISGTEEAR